MVGVRLPKRLVQQILYLYAGITPSVLLLKEEDTEYVRLIEILGVKAFCVPVLRFTFVETDQLQQALLCLKESYSGIVLTSPRATNAIERCFMTAQEPEKIIDALKSIAIYAVGRTTAEWFDRLEIQTLGQQCGSAKDLGQHISSHHTVSKLPILFLCGDKRRNDIPLALTRHQQSFQELKVYESHPREDFKIPAQCEWPFWVVFFSPSGIDVVLHSIENAVNELVETIAIGRTTNSALDKIAEDTGNSSWRAVAVAETPNAQGVASVVRERILGMLPLGCSS